MYRMSGNLGAVNSRNPHGLSRHVQGLLYLLLDWYRRFYSAFASHCALRLWYVDLFVSTEVAIEVC